MLPSNPEQIPGVSEAEISEAVKTLVTTVPATDLEDSDRFCIAVRALAESRAQSGWGGESDEDVAVFVLAAYPRRIGEKFGARPVSNPSVTGEPLLGQLFFLNRDASTGRVMKMPADRDSILEWLEDQGLEKLPVVMIYRQKSMIVYRSAGALGDSRADSLRTNPVPTTPQEVIKALQHSHKTHLLTPSACPRGVWEAKRSSEYVPGPEPEKVIQKQLQIVLSSWFRGSVKAEIEDTTTIGRIDIRLLRINPQGRLEYWIIVELKVIKSAANAAVGKKAKTVTLAMNVDAVCEGVRQSYAFAKNRNADAMLEVFDLRKDKTTDVLKEKPVCDEFAKCQPQPLCHVWPLFGSSSHARIAGWT